MTEGLHGMHILATFSPSNPTYLNMKYLTYLKSLVCSFVLTLSPVVAVFGQEQPARMKVPSAERMQAINDSILEEGLRLYAYERVQWEAADSLMRYGTAHLDQIDGSAMLARDEHTWSFVYVSMARREVLFEYIYDVSSAAGKWSAEVRGITPAEERMARVSLMARSTAIREKGDSIRVGSTSGLNWDCIPVEGGGYRLYLLRGTSVRNVQPFGDDYSFDFDADLNLTSWRRYHRTYMEISVFEGGKKVEGFVHSHTDMTPYITPTDIANFMLYGHDLFGFRQMYVMQTAFEEPYCTVMDAEKRQVTSLPVKTLEKMLAR